MGKGTLVLFQPCFSDSGLASTKGWALTGLFWPVAGSCRKGRWADWLSDFLLPGEGCWLGCDGMNPDHSLLETELSCPCLVVSRALLLDTAQDLDQKKVQTEGPVTLCSHTGLRALGLLHRSIPSFLRASCLDLGART